MEFSFAYKKQILNKVKNFYLYEWSKMHENEQFSHFGRNHIMQGDQQLNTPLVFRNLLFTTILALLTIVEANAQNNIRGYLFDQKTNKPLTNVKVFLEPGEKISTTTANGAFTFDNLPDGTFTIEASPKGFQKLQEEITLSPTQKSFSKRFFLTPDAPTQQEGGKVEKKKGEETKVNAGGKTASVKGFLFDQRTSEPVIFSTIQLVGTTIGALTDINGYFTLSNIAPGNYVIRATSLNYDTLQEPLTLAAGDVVSKKLFLSERVQTTNVVEITANRSKETRQTTANISVTKLTPKEIKMMPAIGGEPDLAQYLQVIPGVVFTGDQGGQLFIRGGAPVQNLTLMDGMLIYNPFHSIGLFSVFETDLIKNADIYTAGFGAEYGGRASSVIDIKTIDGNKKQIGGKVGLNTFNGRAMIEGPIFKGEDGGGSSFLLSARSSFLDQSSKVIYPYINNGAGLPFSFTDFYGKATIASSGGSKVSLQGFNFSDRAGLSGLSGFGWNSYGFGSQFIIVPVTSTVLLGGNVAFSDYKINLIEETVAPRSSGMNSTNAELNLTQYSNRNELKYGVGLVINNTQFRAAAPSGLIQESREPNTEFYGFVKYRYVTDRLVLEPSFRFQYYGNIAVPSLEPRLGLKYNVTEDIRLKLGGGIYSQNLLATQSDRDVVNLFYGYVTSPKSVADGNGVFQSSPIQRSIHGVVGIEWEPTEELEVTVEPYIKTFDPFISINLNKRTASGPDFIMEKGLARGVDVLTKYEKGPLFIQLGYSFAIVERSFGDTTYNPNYDRRHNLNFLGSYSFGKNKSWSFDLRWNYGSGFPFTQTIAFYEQMPLSPGLNTNPQNYNGNLGIYYGSLQDFNRGRLPDFHRLDISIKKKFQFGQHSNLELVASATNVYNRANLFYFDRVNLQRVNQLPLLPTFGLNATF